MYTLRPLLTTLCCHMMSPYLGSALFKVFISRSYNYFNYLGIGMLLLTK